MLIRPALHTLFKKYLFISCSYCNEMILEVTYPIFHALFHAFSTFSILALKVHFKPVYIKIGSHGKKKLVFVWFGEQGGKSGTLSLRRPGTSFGPPFHGLSSPVSGWPLLLELKMRKEVAFVQPRRFSVLVMNLMGRVCLPLCTLSISGAVPPRACSQTARPPQQQERTFLSLGKSK